MRLRLCMRRHPDGWLGGDRPNQYALEKIMLAVMLAVIMFGMGAGITASDLPLFAATEGVVVGIVSQFGLMPLIAFGLSVMLDLPPAAAIGLIMIGCLPGGTTSNMFCYFARGDVALSVTMTTCSTLLALLVMPITLAFYTEPFIAEIDAALPGEGLAIPYRDIVATLALVLVPVAGGLALRRWSVGWAKR